MKTPRKILVIRIDGIGDLLCTTPTIHTLRSNFPESRIDVLVNLGPHLVLRRNNDFDRCFVDYRTKVYNSRWKGLRYFPIRIGRWISWKIFGYDLVIVAHYGFHKRAIELARKVRTNHIAVNIEPEYMASLNDSRIRFSTYLQDQHETVGVHATLQDWCKTPPERMWVFPASDIDKSNRQLTRIGINLTASGLDRQWPLLYFFELIQALGKKYPYILFSITGSMPEVKDFENKSQDLDGEIRNRVKFCFTPSLEEFIAAIADCDLYITSDGGGCHIASGLLVPQVALFQNLKGKLLRWHPWAVPYAMVTSEIEGGTVSSITVKQVITAAEALIEPLLKSRSQALK